ncbi:MAG: hypothetical protein Q8P81_00780 [Nanoarchaeota archaeon]|nr:hypothetical protein [Nanoarchaeota archaeon]
MNKRIKDPRAFDIFGNIALTKFPRETKLKQKKDFANDILKRYRSVTTVLEKTRGFQGRLRKQETKHLAGEKTKEALYTENGCTFRLNLDKTYFSPRLSSERKEIAEKVKNRDSVLVMFAGVAPYPIVIAKNSRAKIIYSNEINREANKYAEKNIELNKLKNKVFLLPGDVKKVSEKIKYLKEIPKTFDVIVMPRPQLKDTFLKEAFKLSKKGTRIFYYDFCKEDETDIILDKIKDEAKKAKKQIKILKTKRAGEIAPYKMRIRVDFKVL